MKRRNFRALALCLTTICAAGIATAQDENKSRTGRAGAGVPTTPGTPGVYTPPASTSGLYTPATMRASEPVRLSTLMNSSLKNQSGESLGQVQDLIVDPSNGQIQFAVISRGGTATPTTTTATTPTTANGQLVAIPWRLVNSGGQGQFTTSVDRTALQNAPTFSSGTWPTMDSTWSQQINSHFGVIGTGVGAPGRDSGTGTGTGTGTGLGNPNAPGIPPTPGTPDIKPPNYINPSSPSQPLPPTPGSGTTPGVSPAPGGIRK